MKVVRLDPSPAFASFGVLTPAGEGAASLLARGAGAGVAPAPGACPRIRRAAEVTEDLPALCGEPALRFRRMDRYGALGYAAAHRALAGSAGPGASAAGVTMHGGTAASASGVLETAAADPGWGVMIGSSLACAGSIGRHHAGLRDRPVASLSPAVFVRTVANAVNGDLAIRWRLGGPSETFVSGWTAGAEALLAGGDALLRGRAARVLAGAVEAPETARPERPDSLQSPPGGGSSGTLVESAAMTVMGLAGRADREEALRLRACLRGHDPHGRFSLAAAIDSLGPIPVGAVIVANTIPADLQRRVEQEAGRRPVLLLPPLAGELGAAGAIVAVALADTLARSGGGPALSGLGGATGGVLVMARDPEGGTMVLAVSR